MNRSLRFLTLLAAAILIGSAGAMVQASPAEAATFRPDGSVRYKSFKSQSGTYIDPSPWAGDNIYNTTGRNQKVVQVAGGSYAPDPHFVFEVRAQNEGAADRFKVNVSGTGDWVAKYFHGTTNITSAVVAGTYRTPTVGSGASVTLKVKVWIDPPGATPLVRLITLTSQGDETKQDSVKVRVEYSPCTC
jgi:hypothetical protein